MDLSQLLRQADRELGKLDIYSTRILNIDLSRGGYVLKEAIQLSLARAASISEKMG